METNHKTTYFIQSVGQAIIDLIKGIVPEMKKFDNEMDKIGNNLDKMNKPKKTKKIKLTEVPANCV